MMLELAVAGGLGFILGAWFVHCSWKAFLVASADEIPASIILQIITYGEKIEDNNNVSSQTVEETPVRGSSPNGGSKRTVH